MTTEDLRRERVDELLDLAQAYRRWNRKQLAQALGRDPSNLSPASGLPKLDLVVELARVLEWSVEDVVRSIWLDELRDLGRHIEPLDEDIRGDFAELEMHSREANRAGRNLAAVHFAKRASEVARTSEERAIAYIRESSGWDGLGRYAFAMDASRRGLAEPGVSTDRRRVLQINLANEYYTLWQPLEAKAIADDLVRVYERQPARNRMNRVASAFAFYVRGHSHRRLMAVAPAQSKGHAATARDDLRHAEHLFKELGDDFDDEAYRGIANTCFGGLVEVEVAMGERDAPDAIRILTEGLDAIVEPSTCPYGDWLESYGWWCICGCNVALHHLDDQRQVQQHLAVFTNKADEIADRTDNWAMRERIVTMEFARRRHFDEWTGVESDWTLDGDDVRAIAGTMGRFPSFHHMGWHILRSARIVRE